MIKGLERNLVWILLGLTLVWYTILVFLSEGTLGGADDITHYRYARYGFRYPHLFLHHWGKPFFTAMAAPFAQFGYNGYRIFNVLAGTATLYFTYRMALLLKIKHPLLVMILILSAPLYTGLMLSGMTEILFSLMLILSIFLFYRKKMIWSAVLLSLLPFVRTEGVVIWPLFALAMMLEKQWKALPFLLTGFIFYSVVGSFHFNDILWVIHEMPYKGNAQEIYGSGDLFHYVVASKYTFGIPMAILALLGLLAWITRHPRFPWFRNLSTSGREWVMEMLVVYLPFMIYFAAHSYVWWKGMGNSVGMIRVMVAVVPPVALLAALGWSRVVELLPLSAMVKKILTGLMALFLLTVPYQIYRIPLKLPGNQQVVFQLAQWIRTEGLLEHKIYYYDPFVCHFLDLDPYDETRSRAFVHNQDDPAYAVPKGSLVVWDSHYGPNEGQLPLDRLMDHPAFELIHHMEPDPPRKTLGGGRYEIYVFQRIGE